MAASTDELATHLTRLDRRYERLDDGTYVISLGSGQPPLALRVAPPVVVAQVDIGEAKVGDTPANARFYRRLLELNATDLLHVAYAIEDGRIVLTAALELANLNLNELEAVLANIDMAIAQHIPVLREMARK